MTSPHTVLVVDDTAAHRYIMSSWLRRAGFEVIEAATGAEALVRTNPHIDAMVLDVNLPDIHGGEVCRRLKAEPSTAHIPVLHVSATAVDAASRTAGLEGGADAYLPEPLDRDEFIATISALCRRHDAQRGAGRTARRLEALTNALVPLHEARSYEAVVDHTARGACAVLGRAVVAMVVADAGLVLRSVCVTEGSALVRGRGPSAVLAPGDVNPAVFGADEVPAPWLPLLREAGSARRSGGPCGSSTAAAPRRRPRDPGRGRRQEPHGRGAGGRRTIRRGCDRRALEPADVRGGAAHRARHSSAPSCRRACR